MEGGYGRGDRSIGGARYPVGPADITPLQPLVVCLFSVNSTGARTWSPMKQQVRMSLAPTYEYPENAVSFFGSNMQAKTHWLLRPSCARWN
jgi:hypothetical protein